jgi:Uncharacterized conserved protein
MKRYITALCAASLLCFGVNAASAQGVSGETYRAGDSIKDKKADKMAGAKTPTSFNKASKLIGMDVKNQQGEKLGDIKDVVIDFDGGKISYLVLSAGGTLGIGDKLLAVPVSAFACDTQGEHLILRATKENIQQAQGLGENWPAVQEPTFGAIPFWQEQKDAHEQKAKELEQQ